MGEQPLTAAVPGPHRARRAGSGRAAAGVYVFAYGSLLLPASLRRTLPGIDPADCIPGRCLGRTRVFAVAFPNDGSHLDKSYRDAAGTRPPFVLFADLGPSSQGRVNGVCVPVSDRELGLLARRERRYELADISGHVRPYPGHPAPAGRVLAFLGRAEFTDPADATRGVVARDYLATTTSGARFWDGRVPGFLADFQASTRFPAPGRVVALERVDPPT